MELLKKIAEVADQLDSLGFFEEAAELELILEAAAEAAQTK